MTKMKEQAIELLQRIPDDKVIYIIDILRSLNGLIDDDINEQDFSCSSSAMGIFSKYANSDLKSQEKDAWSKAVTEKHDNN